MKGRTANQATRKREMLMLCAAVAAMVTCAAAQRVAAQGVPCRYEIAEIIQAPACAITGPPATIATAISPNGRYVAGYFAQCTTSLNEAFVFDCQTNEFRKLPRPAGVVSAMANDVNDSGLAVGGYWTATGKRGFIYDYSSASYVAELQPLPGGAWCDINAINASGVVCGYRSIGSKGDPVNPFTAFIWSADDAFTNLGVMNGPNSAAEDIAEDGTVVGWTGAGEATAGTRGFVHRGKHLTILPAVEGGTTSSLMAVNASGERACGRGLKTLPGGQLASETFIWREGSITALGALPGTMIGFAFGIAGNGSVVGMDRSLQPSLDRAYIWQHGLLRDLNDLVDGPKQLYSAYGMANDGRIVANGSLGGTVAMVLAPVSVQGDAYPDCAVDVDDIISVVVSWDDRDSPADVTGDGVVNAEDLILVINNWSFK